MAAVPRRTKQKLLALLAMAMAAAGGWAACYFPLIDEVHAIQAVRGKRGAVLRSNVWCPCLERAEAVEFSFSGLTDRDLSELKGLGDLDLLRRVSLSGTRVDGSGLKDLPLQHLQSLDLSGTRFNAETAPILEQFADLRELNVAGTLISDRSVTHIVRLRRLVQLDMSSTQITDQSIPRIGDLPELQTINLRNTRITADGLDELTRLKPGLVIETEFVPRAGMAEVQPPAQVQ